MPKAKKIETTEKPQNDLYSLRLTVGEETYESTAPSVVEALQGIKPGLMKSRGLFTLTHDGKTSELRLFPFQIKKLLIHPMTQQIFGKRITSLLQ